MQTIPSVDLFSLQAMLFSAGTFNGTVPGDMASFSAFLENALADAGVTGEDGQFADLSAMFTQFESLPEGGELSTVDFELEDLDAFLTQELQVGDTAVAGLEVAHALARAFAQAATAVAAENEAAVASAASPDVAAIARLVAAHFASLSPESVSAEVAPHGAQVPHVLPDTTGPAPGPAPEASASASAVPLPVPSDPQATGEGETPRTAVPNSQVQVSLPDAAVPASAGEGEAQATPAPAPSGDVSVLPGTPPAEEHTAPSTAAPAPAPSSTVPAPAPVPSANGDMPAPPIPSLEGRKVVTTYVTATEPETSTPATPVPPAPAAAGTATSGPPATPEVAALVVVDAPVVVDALVVVDAVVVSADPEDGADVPRARVRLTPGTEVARATPAGVRAAPLADPNPLPSQVAAFDEPFVYVRRRGAPAVPVSAPAASSTGVVPEPAVEPQGLIPSGEPTAPSAPAVLPAAGSAVDLVVVEHRGGAEPRLAGYDRSQPLLPDTPGTQSLAAREFAELPDAARTPRGAPVRTTLAQLSEQVVRNVRMLTREHGGVVQLRLEPEALGRLTVRVMQDHDVVRVELAVQSHQVREVLQGQLSDLKQQLVDQGLSVGALDVSVDTGAHQEPTDEPSDSATAPQGRGRGSRASDIPLAPAPQAVPEHSGRLDLIA